MASGKRNEMHRSAKYEKKKGTNLSSTRSIREKGRFWGGREKTRRVAV